MAYETIISEREKDVLLIRLNRPEALNALNSVMLKELAQALQEADNDSKVRVIVLTGSEKAFAAGADIQEMSEMGFSEITLSQMFSEHGDAVAMARKPVIAAVAGFALGGGCELAMMCDFILAADSAKFGQPEINLGVMAGLGGTQRLTRFVGKSKAMEMHLTGRFMEAEEAERSGLVSRVVPAKDLIKEAMAVADKIADKGAISTYAIKEAVNRAFETSLSEGLLFERRSFYSLFATDDQTEGMAAFLQKREPHFRDK